MTGELCSYRVAVEVEDGRGLRMRNDTFKGLISGFLELELGCNRLLQKGKYRVSLNAPASVCFCRSSHKNMFKTSEIHSVLNYINITFDSSLTLVLQGSSRLEDIC